MPAGDLSWIEMMAPGVAVLLLALWARRTDFMGWHSGTSILLGALILVLAGLQRTVGLELLVSFWMILLSGITVALLRCGRCSIGRMPRI